MNISKLARVLLMATLIPISYASAVTLDSFEDTVIRTSNPDGKTIKTQLLWNQYEGDPTEGPDIGSEAISLSESYIGNQSLEINVESGNVYAQFYSKVDSTTWEWLRHFITEGDWKLNTYNRLRFWVKLPSGITKAGNGQSNTRLGTYYRRSTGDKSSAESGGNHYYHYYDLESTGEWHQVIMDWHPNNIRGEKGGTEWGQKEHPTNENNFNYFDLLTRFYFEINGNLPSYPSKFYFDGFELYTEENQENIDQIYSLNGVYVPSTNEIQIGWMRNKDENKVNHEIRYSFTDIHNSGWDQASIAPGGTVSPKGWQGYNAMEYSTTSIDIKGHSTIYIAIKPTNSTLFRQIAVPVARDRYISPPLPPGQISITTE